MSRKPALSLFSQGTPLEESLLNEARNSKIIAEWEHYAVFTLFDVKGFRSRPSWIAERLGIAETRATQVLDTLLRAGMIRRTARGRYRKVISSVRTSDGVPSIALRLAHHEELGLAAKKLDEVSQSRRDYSSHTMAIDVKNLNKARVLIRRFRRRLARILESGDRQEVYQLCIQLFPLTIGRPR